MSIENPDKENIPTQDTGDAEGEARLSRENVAGPPAPEYLEPEFVGNVADKALREGRDDDAAMLYENASIRAGGQGKEELSDALPAAADFARMEDLTGSK